MEIKNISLSFTDSAQDEISKIVQELQLVPLADALHKGKNLPENIKGTLEEMFALLVDLFSDQLPLPYQDPEKTLRAVSRDINLSRILRERGVFRMYGLLNQKDEHGLPTYVSLINPIVGHPFATQEEFIGWFCDEAHIARSLLFQRIRLIDRLIELGISLEEAFNLVLQRPYVVDETVAGIGTWNKGELVGIEPEIALQLAKKFAPDQLDEITGMIDSEDQPGLTGIMKPVIVDLLKEVAAHERTKDALKWVRHDLLLKPEIYYSWDSETGALVVELHQTSIDPITGDEAIQPPVIIPFIADTTHLPDEIVKDLIRRLPIKNRDSLAI